MGWMFSSLWCNLLPWRSKHTKDREDRTGRVLRLQASLFLSQHIPQLPRRLQFKEGTSQEQTDRRGRRIGRAAILGPKNRLKPRLHYQPLLFISRLSPCDCGVKTRLQGRKPRMNEMGSPWQPHCSTTPFIVCLIISLLCRTLAQLSLGNLQNVHFDKTLCAFMLVDTICQTTLSSVTQVQMAATTAHTDCILEGYCNLLQCWSCFCSLGYYYSVKTNPQGSWTNLVVKPCIVKQQ